MARPNRRRIGPLLVAPDGRTPLTAVMWRCSKCREAKPETEFPVTDGATGRRRAACKPCEATRQATLRSRERRSSGTSCTSDLRVTVTVGRCRPRRAVQPAPHAQHFFPLGAAIQRLMQEA